MRPLARFHTRLRGAVLAEMVMAGVIGGLIMSVLPGFYFAYIKLWQRETGKLGAVGRADFVVRRIKREVRNARSVTVSSDGKGLTLVLPALTYDAGLGVTGSALDSEGRLVDGDRVCYYYVVDPNGTGTAGGSIYRRLVHADGSEHAPRLVADQIYPQLNPLAASATSPAPVFSYNATTRLVTVHVTTAEPRPTSGTLLPLDSDPRCARDSGQLVRVATSQHPEGVIQCSTCGTQVRPTAHIVSSSAQLRLRNK